MIEWVTYSGSSTNYSRVFDRFRRALNIIAISIVLSCYIHFLEMCSQDFDKLLRALTTSTLRTKLENNIEWLILYMET